MSEIFHSICPVYVASHVALALGYLERELGRVNASLRSLDTLPGDDGRLAHARHTLDYQIRDGGNIPAIWARAEHAETVLLGSTFVNQGGQIVVRVDSGLLHVRQLRGHRFGVSRSLDTRRVDWWRANSQRSIALALALHGVAADEVEFVDVGHGEAFSHTPFGGPGANDARGKEETTLDLPFTPEFGALDRGEVDAIYSTQGRAQIYERTGRFKIIEDLSRSPDWTVQLAASPYTLAASRRLVEERPEIAIAYLRANIQAARWIRDHLRQAAEIFHARTYDATLDDVLAVIAHVDFTPSLSDLNLAAIDLGKRFLLERGFIGKDFDVAAWADRGLLQQALDSVAADDAPPRVAERVPEVAAHA